MPTKRIGDLPQDYKVPTIHLPLCNDSDHAPNIMMYLEPGVYEHTCPSCKKVTRFNVVAAL